MTSLSVVDAGTAYPLAAYGRVEMQWSNVIGKPDVVDYALDLPGSSEIMFVPQVPKTRIFSVRIVVAAASEAACNDSLTQLASLLWSPSAPILFRRSIPSASFATASTPGVQTSEAYAYYLSGFDAERPAPNIALLAPQFRMLSAYWYDVDSDAAVSV